MRPLQLKLKGINSYREEQVIDFETLTSQGLFGIFGPTGSGKTTRGGSPRKVYYFRCHDPRLICQAAP